MAIEIDSIEKLIAFSRGEFGRGSSSEYLDVMLTKDLDFADYEEEYYSWPGCTGTWYCNFDGKGHTINNIYANVSGDWAFFNTLYGHIQNLKLTNMYVTAINGQAAAFVVMLYDTGSYIKNCHASGQAEALYGYASGLVHGGNGRAVVEECSFSGVVKAQGGGCPANAFVLHNDSVTRVVNSLFVGDVISLNQNAGCCGGRTAYVNCEFRGTVQCPNGYIYTGADSGSLMNCITVLKAGCRWVGLNTSGYYYNSYYDSNEAEAAGLPVTLGPTPATTAELKSASWLRSKGFAI